MNIKKKKILYYVIEIIYLLSVFGFMLVMKNKYSTSNEYDFMTFLFMSLATVGLLWILGPALNRLAGFLILMLYSLYLVAQRVYFRGFDQYFRFNTAFGLSNETKDVGGAIQELIKFEDFVPFITLTIIFVVFTFIYFLLQRKINIKKIFRLGGIFPLIIGILLMSANIRNINATQEDYVSFDIYKSEYYIYKHAINTNQFVDKMGLLTFCYRDAETALIGTGDDKNYVNEINEYFASKNNTILSNDLTGILKGKGLLIIQAESLNLAAIDKELTPNLYFYINNGLNIKGFNTPLLVGSTSDTEFMSNTSLIPETNGYPVCYEYIENVLPQTIGNLFAEEGYECNAYHNNYAEYYNRDIAFDKYGYKFFDCYHLGMENLRPDSELAEKIGWISIEQEKFLGYWISYSGHQPYNFDATGVCKDDVKKIQELYPGLDEEYVSYFAKNMDFDRALGRLVDIMDWSGRFDDFAIVVYGDHKAKGIDFSKGTNFDKIMGMNSEDNPELYNTPLFIWAPGIPHMEIEKPCTALDILPTIANLYDIKYDSKFALGHDIFDENYRGFIFNAEGDYITEDFRYNLLTDSLVLKNPNFSETNAREQIAGFNKMKEISNKILVSDYFSQIEKEK